MSHADEILRRRIREQQAAVDEAFEIGKRVAVPAVHEGSMSHLDMPSIYGYIVDPMAHENSRTLAKKLGFTPIRPLLEAVEARGYSEEEVRSNSNHTETDIDPYDADLEEMCDGYAEMSINPVIPESPILIHDRGLELSYKGRSTGSAVEIVTGIIGHKEGSTYLKRPAADYLENPGGLGEELWNLRLHIDTAKLAELRDIYSDPEGIWTSRSKNPEFGMTFFLLGGIPVSSIYKMEVSGPL